MPYKRKDSPVWWASYVDHRGKRIRCSTGTTNRKEAEALEAKWKLEAYRMKQWDEDPPVSFEEVIVLFLKDRADKRSAKQDKIYAKQLRRSFEGAVMDVLRAQQVNEHIARRKADGVSNAMINRELSLLSAAINHYNKELERELPNPVRGRKLKEPEGRIRWISKPEAAALIEAARQSKRAPYLADFLILALNTGCRKQEMLGLEWNRVNLQEGIMFLEANHTKTARRRSIPLNSDARAALLSRMRFRAEHCPGSPWVFSRNNGVRVGDVKKSFATACAKAGIKDFRIHDLRHTCAAWLVTAGVPLAEVRDLLGHASITMTEKYAHLAPERVRAAVTLIEGMSRSGHVGK